MLQKHIDEKYTFYISKDKNGNEKTYKFKNYKHICKYCGKEYISCKKNQKVCSKQCNGKLHYKEQLGKNNYNDKSFFNNLIDTEEKAYILGMLTADGSISSGKITLSLKEEDKYLLEKIKNYINPNRKLYYCKKSYSFYWINKEDIDFLKSVGFTTKKQYDTTMCKIIPHNLMNHYIRGWFDGDGCIYESTTKDNHHNPPREYVYKFISITTGSNIAKEELNNFFHSIGINSKVCIDCRSRKNRNDTYYIKIYRKKDVQTFFDYIYNNANIYMLRKHNKFMI